MPSQKKMEQCMTWLRSQAADQEDILNGINAQITIEIIEELRNRNRKLGLQIGQLFRKYENSLAEKSWMEHFYDQTNIVKEEYVTAGEK